VDEFTLGLGFVSELLAMVLVVEAGLIVPQLIALFVRSRWREQREAAAAWFWDTRSPTLLQSLDDPKRRAAWVTQARKDDPRVARDALLQFLVATSGSYRERLADVYRDLGLLERDLREARSFWLSTRLRALRRLTLVASIAERDAVVQLRERSWTERVLVAQILGRIGRAEDVAARLHAWSSQTRLHEHTIRMVVASMSLAEFRRLLVRWTEFHSPSVRRDLIALGAVRAPAILEDLLPSIVTDAEVEVRIGACQALVHLPRAVASLRLAQLCADPAWEVRAQAVKAVGRLEDTTMCETLERALADSAFWVRQNAAAALARLGDSGHAALERAAEGSQDRFARDAAGAELARIRVLASAGRAEAAA
jgi:hypothetical protein